MEGDFARFHKIFGIDTSDKKKTPVASKSGEKRKNSFDRNSGKKKRLKADQSFPKLPLTSPSFKRTPVLNKTPVRTFREKVTPQQLKFDSPDKKEILQHLSCNLDEFSKNPGEDSDSKENDLSKNFRYELCNLSG